MKCFLGLLAAGVFSFGTPLAAQPAPAVSRGSGPDPANAVTTRMVTVAEGVELEVVDWGGTGRPVVLLAGLGGTAHAFDGFAPKLTPACHVLGITRRGFGKSTTAASGYAADELGDDVVAVIDALQLDRPVLVGHSFAGAELSSVANRHAEKIAGVVYLDAAYSYAFYDESRGDLLLDGMEVRSLLEQLQPGKGSPDPRPVISALLENLPRLERALRTTQERMQFLPPPPGGHPPPGVPGVPPHVQAIFAGQRKFTTIPVPALAIYAVPHDMKRMFPNDPEAQARAEAQEATATEAQARAFEVGVPSARVVRLAHADHQIYKSNEEDVLREMQAFINGLP